MAIKQERKTLLLSELKEFEGNPNMHPEEQIAALAKSIEKYGQYYPIVVDEGYRILAGHGKKKALERLGKATAEVIVMSGLSDKDKKRLVIEDNKIQSLSFVKYDAVEKIIKEIGETDIIGFNEDYLMTIINEGKTELKEILDNAGTNLAKRPEAKDDSERVSEIPDKVADKQERDYSYIEEGVQNARTIICPHCGKEIVL